MTKQNEAGMKRFFSTLPGFLVAIMVFTGCSRNDSEIVEVPDLAGLTVTPSMKGWELYSWPEGNTWKFSFLIGTNRLKSLSEVSTSTGAEVLIRVTGVDSAKMVVNKFPQGETITLVGQGFLNNAWQGQHGSLQLPPQAIIDELHSIAARKSVTFNVSP